MLWPSTRNLLVVVKNITSTRLNFNYFYLNLSLCNELLELIRHDVRLSV